MKSSKNIQIEEALFCDLCAYVIENADYENPRYQRIMVGIQRKIDAINRHSIYTRYKNGETEEIRKTAREEYLKERGIIGSFQWNDEQDVNVLKGRLSV